MRISRQSDSAQAICHAEGRGFESHHPLLRARLAAHSFWGSRSVRFLPKNEPVPALGRKVSGSP
jgi:hypothetical protein